MPHPASLHRVEGFAADLPDELQPLRDLALDLRSTWNEPVRQLFAEIDPELWRRAPENPWILLATAPRARLAALAADVGYVRRLRAAAAAQARAVQAEGWFARVHPEAGDARIAYISAEVGISEALPLYAGGLGVLAGDLLKSSSTLGVPVVGVSLLYTQGFFRQYVSADGWQHERYPVTPLEALPITECRRADGSTLTVSLQFPGRPVDLLVWQARIGGNVLLLLDANLPSNAPADRDITRELYANGREMRLQQELVLGVGGWRALEEAGLSPDVLHMNEGHTAFAAFERARSHAARTGLPYGAARLATMAGNLFTTHTVLAAAFDSFPPEMVLRYLAGPAAEVGLRAGELLGYGRQRPDDPSEPFGMGAFALRHAAACNGVSQLHGAVSRRLFRPYFPRVPDVEVPVGAVTNGVHMPSWVGSPVAALLPETPEGRDWSAAERLADRDLWRARTAARTELIAYARERLAEQWAARGASRTEPVPGSGVLDPDVLTIGFARRFTAYKRPTLLLDQPERLRRLLLDPARPVQIVMSGKAHPGDDEGKRALQTIVRFSHDPQVSHRFVFLEDDDLDVTRHLVCGVDVWLNTPERQFEASGTSGMKVLPNGGLHLSVPDGWWAEADAHGAGWRIGPPPEAGRAGDAGDGEALYALLEGEVVPNFYSHDPVDGLPRTWLKWMRTSMSRLAPQFSSDRMVREYLQTYYLPALARVRALADEDAAERLASWARVLLAGWPGITFGEVDVRRVGDMWKFDARVSLPGIPSGFVQAQLYAEGEGGAPVVQAMEALPGPPEGYDRYVASVPASRPAEHYTVRIVPHHPLAVWPSMLPLVAWER